MGKYQFHTVSHLVPIELTRKHYLVGTRSQAREEKLMEESHDSSIGDSVQRELLGNWVTHFVSDS